MERVGGRLEKLEGHCSTGQNPQRAVVPMEEEEEDKGPEMTISSFKYIACLFIHLLLFYLFIYLLQLGCHLLAAVILHVYKI